MFPRLLTWMFCLFVAATASQMPEFAQQYRQRLGGAVDELRRVVEQFDGDARTEGLDREEALKRYGASRDRFLEQRGRSMSQIIGRYERLRQQQAALVESAPFARLWPVYRQLDGDVSRETMRMFEPAMPITTEGLSLATIGLVLGRMLAPLLGLVTRQKRRGDAR
jgi:Protein of unknown function (DUF2937)